MKILHSLAWASTLMLSSLLLTGLANAKHGNDGKHVHNWHEGHQQDDHHSGKDDGQECAEFYGMVESRPVDTLHGKWQIGGRSFTMTAATQFDQTEGDLTVGSCAKVELRDGQVHELDSEPLHDCDL
jgi:hypothetical protein